MAHSGRTATSEQPGPIVFVLFGATGDLAKRMVLPAFFRLAQGGLLPKNWRLIGNGRGDVAHEDFQGHVHDVLTRFGPHPDEGPWTEFRARLRLDTPREREYFRHGGILQYVLRRLLSES